MFDPDEKIDDFSHVSIKGEATASSQLSSQHEQKQSEMFLLLYLVC